MKKNYELKGMSCGGCVSSVKKVLLQLPGVEDAEVHLHPQSVVLTMSEEIDVVELQAQLNKAGHYTIKEAVSIY
jgi:copper chaperone CopZ